MSVRLQFSPWAFASSSPISIVFRDFVVGVLERRFNGLHADRFANPFVIGLPNHA